MPLPDHDAGSDYLPVVREAIVLKLGSAVMILCITVGSAGVAHPDTRDERSLRCAGMDGTNE